MTSDTPPPRRYAPVSGHYDEVYGPSGHPRRHWRRLTTTLARMGADDLGRRWQEARQLIESNGITYNVYGDPKGAQRPWPLDAVPLVLSAAEWTHLEHAVAQRATLLNAILQDLYGRQSLLRTARLPPGLVFENPGFLRPCLGIRVPKDVYLFHYAVDVARAPDGTWWVIDDRTQAPSGAGYALENRLVAAQVLPEAFRQSRVRRLAGFFQEYREGLQSLAPGGREEPLVVLLTPGPHNETFFEHAFLARHLGATLVEGSDLIVRDARVFLKTVAGLVPVDVILRRQDDHSCDPLELEAESELGVPGLVHAVRSGQVTVANALGSGLMAPSAFLGFLPGLCRALLGEELRMPSVATWWCGQDEARRYVAQHLDRLVLKPAFARTHRAPVFGARLSVAERTALIAELDAKPGRFVAQEQVALSTAPVWTSQGFAPRHVVLRVFATWRNGEYHVMPGGLTRVSTSTDSLDVTMQAGGGSKDTWVLVETGAPIRDDGALPSPPVAAARVVSLPSRVADDLYWLGRYVERVESEIRIARALEPALSGERDLGGRVSADTALELLGRYGYVSPEARGLGMAERLFNLERGLNDLLFDEARPGGILWTMERIREIAGRVKERLSGDTWRVLSRLDVGFRRVAPRSTYHLGSNLELLDQTVLTLSAFAGLMTDSMTRGDGWRFLDTGRRLERGLWLIELMRHALVTVADGETERGEVLLQAADCSITYRARYRDTVRGDRLLALVLFDQTNPRSVAFQLETLASHLSHLSRVEAPAAALRLINEARDVLLAASSESLAWSDATGRRRGLEQLLDGFQRTLTGVSDAVSDRYLSHLARSRVLASA